MIQNEVGKAKPLINRKFKFGKKFIKRRYN